jgi:hypothetical protein
LWIESIKYTYQSKEKFYIITNELFCRWGVTMRSITWLEQCADAGGFSKGESIEAMRQQFLSNELPAVLTQDIAVGTQIEKGGWKIARIK